MISYILNFLLTEIYLYSGFATFWLIVSTFYFLYQLAKRFKEGESLQKQNFFEALPLTFLFIIFLVLPQIFHWTKATSQIIIILGFIGFYFLIRLYQRFYKSFDFFRLYAPIVFGILSYLFFRSNLFEAFFFKELLMFFALFLFFESYRYIFKLNGKAPAIFSIVPTFILLEFLWILNFLPVNFLTLAMIWLIFFVLTNEIWLLNAQKMLNLKHFLPEVVFSAVLVVVLLLTSSWRMF
jgi:hypothetical protein